MVANREFIAVFLTEQEIEVIISALEYAEHGEIVSTQIHLREYLNETIIE